MMEPGIYPDIDETTYHTDRDSLSHSGAKLIHKAPALYRHRLTHPEHRDAFDFGSAAHALVLGQPIEELVVIVDAENEGRPTTNGTLIAVGALVLPDPGPVPVTAECAGELGDVLIGKAVDLQREDDGVITADVTPAISGLAPEVALRNVVFAEPEVTMEGRICEVRLGRSPVWDGLVIP